MGDVWKEFWFGGGKILIVFVYDLICFGLEIFVFIIIKIEEEIKVKIKWKK